MNFEQPLIPATLIKRYKRFLADVHLDCGKQVTAHCPNTGSMKTCGSAGDRVYLSHHNSPTRKLSYTWELTETQEGFIGINTHRPNRVVVDAIERGLVPELKGYESLRTEVRYGDRSRIDILLEANNMPPCYVEIKNVTLLSKNDVIFPDAVTERGLKHLKELSKQHALGNRAAMFYLVNRPEGSHFRPAQEIDPTYAKALKAAHKDGLEILIYRSCNSLDRTEITKKIPLKWN
ncbi:MAG: DNA/RNA nuclease SfsA [Oligoflexales bacterium]